MSVANNCESNVYRLKNITFNGPCSIVTQHSNGPCGLVAAANVLLLRGSLSFPGSQTAISSTFLLDHIADLLLSAPPTGALHVHARQLDSALSSLEQLQHGMEVDVRFTGVTSFAPTPGLDVLSILGIPLYHTWLRDPTNTKVAAVVGDLSRYELIDRIITYKTSEDHFKSSQARQAEEFLENAPNHMTAYGLSQLALSMDEEQLGVLFRNQHFVTICKRNGAIYQLVTDEGFIDRDDIVWETLNTIDGVGKFVNHDFESEDIITIMDDYETRESIDTELVNNGNKLGSMGHERDIDDICELTGSMYCKSSKVCPSGHQLKEVPVIIRRQEQHLGYGKWSCSGCKNDTLAAEEGTRFRCDYHKVKTQLTPFKSQWRGSMECDYDLCGECFYEKQTETDINDNIPENLEYRNCVIQNIKKLLLEHPNGIFERNFTSMYRDAFGEKIDYQELGYPKQTSNKSKFLQTLSGSVLEMEYSSASRLYIKPSKSLLAEIDRSQRNEWRSVLDALELPDENLPNDSFDNTVCGVRKQVQYPPDLKEGSNMNIIVTEVVSPAKFWFQLLGEETSEALENLMCEMESFYRNEEKNYRLDTGNRRDKCRPGVIMAAPYLNNESHDFHRVHINKISKNNVNKVEVFYVDYGTIERIPISCLRILHEKFSKLPAQALEGKLWGLAIPKGKSTWPKESARRFLNLVGPLNELGVGCFSIVKRIQTDSSNRVLHLQLIDAVTTRSPEGLCINQQLIQEGLAKNLGVCEEDGNNNLFNDTENIEEAGTVNNNNVVVSQSKFFISQVKSNLHPALRPGCQSRASVVSPPSSISTQYQFLLLCVFIKLRRTSPRAESQDPLLAGSRKFFADFIARTAPHRRPEASLWRRKKFHQVPAVNFL